MTSRELNQDASLAKPAAEVGPMFIADRGRPAHVLLTAQACQAQGDKGVSLADQLAMSRGAEIKFEPPRSRTLHRTAALG